MMISHLMSAMLCSLTDTIRSICICSRVWTKKSSFKKLENPKFIGRFFQEDSTFQHAMQHSSRLENQKEDWRWDCWVNEQLRFDHKLESVFHPTVLKGEVGQTGMEEGQQSRLKLLLDKVRTEITLSIEVD